MLSKMREYLKYLIPFLLGVFLFALITNFDGTVAFLGGLWGGLWYMLSRILGGFGLAYMLNIFVNFLKKRFRFPAWLAVVAAYTVLLGLVVWLILYIIPYMGDSVNQLITAAPGFAREAQDFISGTFSRLDEQGLSIINTFIENVANQLTESASSLLDMSAILPAVRVAGRSLINLSFWFMISVYALMDKERLLCASQRLMRAFMRPDKVDSRIQFCSDANRIFSRYVSGKVLDSLIIGLLSLILYYIFGLEMTPFLAFIAFVFNMIPYFGPIIGMIVSVVILLCFSPLQALYCLIISVVLQTLDGSVIAPKILGDSVGLSPLLTLIAISIGGDVAGLMGIFLGVPVFAVFKILVVDRWVASRLARAEASEAQDLETQNPETQDPMVLDLERQDPETQAPVAQDLERQDPETQDPVALDLERQDPETPTPETPVDP